MVTVKSRSEVLAMRKAGKIVAKTLEMLEKAVVPGITTGELNNMAAKYIKECGASASFLGYNGFPKSVCISVNDELIHGIPGKRALRDGDIVSVDVGAKYEGYHGDAARTFPVGTVSPEAARLIDVTRQSFFEGLPFCRDGYRISDVSAAVGNYVEGCGFSIVREYCGHGIGRELHEDPNIPNYGGSNRGIRIKPGMTFAIEPMVNMGRREIYVARDRWTVLTKDQRMCAHYENTVLVTGGEPELLTL